MRRRSLQRGYTLIELMMVVTLVSILATMSVNEYDAMLKRAKRVEATLVLSHLWKVQSMHYNLTGRYAADFDELADFQLDGARKTSSRVWQLRRYTVQLSQPWGPESYYAVATGQLDSDTWPDILEMRERVVH